LRNKRYLKNMTFSVNMSIIESYVNLYYAYVDAPLIFEK
jgi:hypothetical protein